MGAHIADLIALQVQKSPEAIALREYNEPYRRVSYGRLWQLAAESTSHIMAARGRRGVVIALDRSLEMVVAMLASVRAGVPYVLLDPAAPVQRNQLVAEMLRSTKVVASRAQELWSLGDLVPVYLEDKITCDGSARTSLLDIEDIVYFASTAGSTGAPKLIKVPNRSVVTFLTDTTLCTVGPGKVMASVSGPLSDATTMEIFKPLIAGGSVAVTPHPLGLEPSDWNPLLKESGISHLFLFSPLLEMLGRQDPEVLPGLDVLMFGGDAIDPSVVGNLLKASSPGRLVHGYGPTEVTVFGSAYECKSAIRMTELGTVPLGRALDGYRISIIDDSGRPINGPGVGQIQFAGPGIANGYLNVKEGPFLPPPQGGRWARYNTGDRGERTTDGELLFLGRMDRQVKIKGHRVEPTAVEQLLAARFGGMSFVVRVAAGGSGSQLTCFYTQSTGGVDLDEMKTMLHGILPAVSIPTRWLKLNSFPLTALGKIDREQLRYYSEDDY